jgi:hypothetical protein
MIGKAKKFDFNSMDGLERKEIEVNGKQNSSNFVFSKAENIDNRPEKA